jgi:hypothetical protein
MMIGASMPKQHCYIVRMIDKTMKKQYGLYYDGETNWVPVNMAKNYSLEYANRGLSLTPGVHELLMIEPNGTLTHIR